MIASRVGAVEEVLDHERTALLVTPDDPAELAAAALRLYADDGLRERLVESGRDEVLGRFTDEAALRIWADVLGRVCPRSQGAPRPLTTA